MKRIIQMIMILVLVIMSLEACNQTPSKLELGNTNGNLNNLGLYVEKDGWVYYTDIMDELKLKKKKSDDTEVSILPDTGAVYLNVIGDWIYYIKITDNFIYKMKTDGSEPKRIGDVLVTNQPRLTALDNYLYFTNGSDQGKLYRINTNGTGLKKLVDTMVASYSIEDDWIYYVTYTTEFIPQIWKAKIDGTKPSLVSESQVYQSFVVYKGWIYFDNVADDGKLYRVDTNGQNKTKLSDEVIQFINIIDDKLSYFISGNQLIVSELDGSNPIKILDDQSTVISYAAGWIYYRSVAQYGRMYRIKADGSNNEKAYQFDMVSADPDGTPIVEGLGVSNGNMINESLYFQVGDWIYYDVNNTTQKIKIDGTEKTLVSNLPARYFNHMGDWVYFTDYSQHAQSIARMRLDASDVEVIVDEPCAQLIVRDEWIYFTDISDQYHLYKVKVDGTELSKLSSNPVFNLNLSNDWIIYTDHDYIQENEGVASIYRIKTDGTMNEKIITTPYLYVEFTVDDDWIYYNDRDYSDTGVNRINLDGTQESVFLAERGQVFGFDEQWIYYYYESKFNNQTIIRKEKNGTLTNTLRIDGINYVYLLDDKIIYCNMQGQTIIMDLDGTDAKYLTLE